MAIPPHTETKRTLNKIYQCLKKYEIGKGKCGPMKNDLDSTVFSVLVILFVEAVIDFLFFCRNFVRTLKIHT